MGGKRGRKDGLMGTLGWGWIELRGKGDGDWGKRGTGNGESAWDRMGWDGMGSGEDGMEGILF